MHRLLFLTSSCFVFLLFLGLSACSNRPPAGTHVIQLTDSIINPLRNFFQVYWTVADTSRWKATLAAADTIYEDGNYRKLRSESIWYEMRKEKGEWRSSQSYPGWERQIDSVSRRLNIIRMLDNNQVKAEIPAADVVVGQDSFRIGVINVLGKAFGWQTFNDNHPDYLILTTSGNSYAPIVMDQDNIGGISRKTVFRVGRKYYVLKSLTEDRRELVIEETEVGREFPLTAELDLYYKRIPVLSLDSVKTTIRHTAGKDMAIYFTHGINFQLSKIDSLYRELPEVAREKLEIAVVSRNIFREEVKRYVTENDIQIPVYVATENTCKRLNCHPWMPYFVGITERGRISTFNGWPYQLEERLLRDLGQDSLSRK